MNNRSPVSTRLRQLWTSIRPLTRRFVRLSARRKLLLVATAALFMLVVVAAYYRMTALFLPALVLLVLLVIMAAMRIEAILKRASASARRNAQLLRAVPVDASRSVQLPLGTAGSWASDTTLTTPKIVQRLVKLRSFEGRDILVRKVTEGQWDWKDMETALEMYRAGGPARKSVAQILDSTVKTRLLLVADLCYRQNLRPEDMLNAATLYRYVYQKMGASPFLGKKRGEFYLDSLSQTGRGDQTLKFQGLYDIEKLNPTDLHLFRANAKNPFRHQSHTGEEWLTEVNAIFESAGLAPIRLRPGTDPAFARLSTDPVSMVETGPLVTVVMPVFRPDEYTDLAIQSAIGQSYRNLEIIVVDDGSGTLYTDRLDKWASADARIRVIKSTVNAGAYTSRNIGYSLASGEYLTIFDGDDWQHPQKIEMLVSAALQQTDHRLVSSPWSRADADLMFHYRGWRGAYVTPAHVSALFPVQVIRENLGFWDTVRKAADTEFILRYQMLVNSDEPLEVTNVPMTFSLVGANNLSMDDFRLGYRSPDRVAYRDSYEHWHRKIGRGEHSGYMSFDADARCFPAPARFLPVREVGIELDLVVVGDFAAEESTTSEMWKAIEDARTRGLSVGVMHVPSIVNTVSIDASFSRSALDEFELGALRRVEVTDSVASRRTIVFDPTAFQFMRELPSGHVAMDVVVHATESPYDRRTRQQRYSVGTVARNVKTVFGGPVRWRTSEPDVYEALSRNLPRASDLELIRGVDMSIESADLSSDGQSVISA
ncbi:glycosyltransferase family 2 protein [Arthrobacter sp. MDT1-48-3]